MKLDTITFEYAHCGECQYVDCTWVSSKSKMYCTKLNPVRRLNRKVLWGKIPDWCILPDKEEK